MHFLDVLMQWIHVSSAAVAVGGIFTLRFVGCPAMKNSLDDLGRSTLLQAFTARFKRVVHSSIALLLLSGGWLLWRAWPLARQSAVYRHAIELKVLLALAVFFLAIMLTVTRPQPNFFQRNRDKWLAINFLLALIVIALAAFLRRMQ
jgi:uncharacterized membrane protein